MIRSGMLPVMRSSFPRAAIVQVRDARPTPRRRIADPQSLPRGEIARLCRSLSAH